MNLQFGTGAVYAIPNQGNLAANPTPQRLGVLQECSVEFKGDLKKLYGQKQFAAATARGKIDVTGKFKMASLDPNALNQLYFGQQANAGVNRLAADEPHLPGASVVVAGSAAFVRSYGVVNGDTGLNMVLVGGTPAVGQYAISAPGTYVFATGETASQVLISYLAYDSTKGVTIGLKNQLMGYAPEFAMIVANFFRGKYFACELTSCTMGMLSIPTKQEDFWVIDGDFNANADASDNLGSIYADTI